MSAESQVDSVPRRPRKGEELEVVVEGFDARGHGVASFQGERVRVVRGPVGARVRARVLRRRKGLVEVVALETLERGAHAAEPRCEHFRSCGGCSFQDLEYAAQLEGLRKLVEEPLAARGLLTELAVEPVVPAPASWRYRNKMEFTFSNRRWIAPGEPENAPNGFALGLHAQGLHTKVVDVRSCAIQSEAADAILTAAREIALEQGLAPWDAKTHTGLLRHLVLRAARSGEVLANLVTSADAPEAVEPYARALVQRCPAITTLVQTVNERPAATAIGQRERVLHGPGHIIERMCGLEFSISAGSFFQTNTAAAERLFEAVREEAALGPHERAWDLYCGTGTIALVLAQHGAEVVGFEIVPAAIADARANAQRNRIDSARFVEGDALAGLASFANEPAPDVVIVDPPRAGLHPKLVPRLAAIPARRLVYVSCNPKAAAGDVAALAASGWKLARVRPFDLFPHTPHVECVLRLERA